MRHTSVIGVLAAVPLVARTLFPRLTAQLRKHFGRIVQAPPLTRRQLERTEPTPGPENGHIGFTLDELTNAAGAGDPAGNRVRRRDAQHQQAAAVTVLGAVGDLIRRLDFHDGAAPTPVGWANQGVGGVASSSSLNH